MPKPPGAPPPSSSSWLVKEKGASVGGGGAGGQAPKGKKVIESVRRLELGAAGGLFVHRRS